MVDPQLPNAPIEFGVHEIERHWAELARSRQRATALGLVVLAVLLFSSLWFANESNAGKFGDRLPHIFDFVSWLYPKNWADVPRALLDLPSPNADGTFATDFEVGRVYLTENFYVPEYLYLLLQTINIALLSTLLGFFFGFLLCFLAARNATASAVLRSCVRRALELMRAFPEIVIAVLFASILSVGPVPAIIAVTIHTIGALGKLFFEVVENADMKPVEGLDAVGANWTQKLRYGLVPQVLPNFLSYGLLRLESNVRQSTIIGAVGGGGIGAELALAIKRGYGIKAVAMLILLFATILIIDQISGAMRRRLTGQIGLVAALPIGGR